MKISINAIYILLILLSAVAMAQEEQMADAAGNLASIGQSIFIQQNEQTEAEGQWAVNEISSENQGIKSWGTRFAVSDEINLKNALALAPAQKKKRKRVAFRLYSEPPGADVIIKGKVRGQTPYGLRVPQGATLEVTVSMSGYEPWMEVITFDENIKKTAVLKKKSGFSKKYFYLSGAAIVGTGVIYYFATKDDESGDKNNNWPTPPTRPN